MPNQRSTAQIEQILRCYDDYPAIYARLTRHTSAEALAAMLSAATSPMRSNAMTPTKTHLHFTGREADVAAIKRKLNEAPLVAIIGLGGMGKTTLTLELIEQLQADGQFTTVIWTSAKYEQFVSESIQSDSPTATAESLAELIDQIVQQALPNAAHLPPQQQQQAVAAALASQPMLIVLDNFETVAEPAATTMLQGLHAMLGQSKVLITSRHQLRYEAVSQRELSGLAEEAGLTFLRTEAGNRQVAAVAQAKRADLRKIYQACGGQPLAMRLLVGQLNRRSLSRVLDYLKNPQADRSSFALYQFIYQLSWEGLSHDGQELLVALAVQPPNMPMFADDLESISELPRAVFDQATDELVRCSLVEVSDGLEKQYQLHPLTHQFIKSDITKEW